ncbi:hypothetical protein ACGFZK_33445 [Streptomyces sp. NPDC048257]
MPALAPVAAAVALSRGEQADPPYAAPSYAAPLCAILLGLGTVL